MTTIGRVEEMVAIRIDIAEDKAVLAVVARSTEFEMDGAMYHSGFDKEQSDYNRQKVLEDKGWELYRIWSTNWLDDTDREFSRLTQLIDKNIAG